jgi:hypothetical protein
VWIILSSGARDLSGILGGVVAGQHKLTAAHILREQKRILKQQEEEAAAIRKYEEVLRDESEFFK